MVKVLIPKDIKRSIKILAKKMPRIFIEIPIPNENEKGEVEVDILTADEMRVKLGNEDKKFDDNEMYTIVKTKEVKTVCIGRTAHTLSLSDAYKSGVRESKISENKMQVGLNECLKYFERMKGEYQKSLA